MIYAGNADAYIMSERVEIAACDRWSAEQAMREELEDQERWDCQYGWDPADDCYSE